MRQSGLRVQRQTLILRGSDCGQALLETALTLPLLALLLVGAVELGRVAYASIAVSNAARAGAQYGAQNGGTAGDTTGISVAAANEAPNLTGLTTTSSYSCVCSDGTASDCSNAATDCPNSHIETIVVVKTQFAFNSLIHVPGIPAAFTLRGYASQKTLQ